ncbi:hypothetical protein BD779DRAFT_1481212 [Infundibulicybe gibba]|nr:hypothetical protein BD779DRAFT_1481212 [Infundibulicybe gibba]
MGNREQDGDDSVEVGLITRGRQAEDWAAKWVANVYARLQRGTSKEQGGDIHDVEFVSPSSVYPIVQSSFMRGLIGDDGDDRTDGVAVAAAVVVAGCKISAAQIEQGKPPGLRLAVMIGDRSCEAVHENAHEGGGKIASDSIGGWRGAVSA